MPDAPNRDMGVTIGDVAKAAGVSIRTVSRVLNASPRVSQATRLAIEIAIARLAYSPNNRARAMAMGRSNLIALVHDDADASGLDRMQRHIAEILAQHGYELVVHPVRFDDPQTATGLQAFMLRSRVDGLIILAPTSQSNRLARRLAPFGAPIVAMGPAPALRYGCRFIVDEGPAAAQIARHLQELGHRRFGLILGPSHLSCARRRWEGFVGALEAGPDLEVFAQDGDYGFHSGLAAGTSLLAMAHPPTAIFACNDIMAAAVLRVAHERGVATPGQLSVAGFGDSDLARMVFPPLTTARPPIETMARAAAQAVVEMINEPNPAPRHERLDLTLVRRASTGPAPLDQTLRAMANPRTIPAARF